MSIEIRQVTKFYGKQKALDNVSFSLQKGELVGFLGPNGAGKSTLMKIITGYIPANQGEILINGKQISVENTEIKKDIGYLPENNPLYSDLYIQEYLEIVARIYKVPHLGSRVNEMMFLTGLEKEKNKKIGVLSKGFRQRVGLAQALIHDPSVLILDEPTNGLDPNQLGEIRAMICEISREKTVLLSSHILQEIETICRRVVIINHGRLVADSELNQLKEIRMNRNQQVFVEFDQPVDLSALMEIRGVEDIIPEAGGWLVSSMSGEDVRPAIFRFAVKSGFVLLAMAERQQNLENIFRQLTKEQ